MHISKLLTCFEAKREEKKSSAVVHKIYRKRKNIDLASSRPKEDSRIVRSPFIATSKSKLR